jgi:dihydropyrimidinase
VEEAHLSSFKFIRSDPVLEAGEEGYSGIPDDLFLEGLRVVAAQEGCTAIVHCENRDVVQSGMARAQGAGGQRLLDWCRSRPSWAETESVRSALYWDSLAKAPLLIAHMSVGAGVQALRKARIDHPWVYGETCPQYLMLDESMGLGVHGKCAPPVRTKRDREVLWRGLARGDIDVVGSDHCAYTEAYKGSDMWTAPTGVPGTGMILPILLSAGVNRGRLTLERMVAVTSANAARIFGFYPRKGSISVGADADLVILDLDREVTIEPEVLNSVVDYTPYRGYQCRGWPLMTIKNGRVVAEAGKVVDDSVRGRCLEHPMFSGAE